MAEFTHLDEEGRVRMVDVTAKAATVRTALAGGEVRMRAETFELIRDGKVKKGNVLETARIAGIMAAKRTAELIPMCHPLNITHVQVDFVPDPNRPSAAFHGVVACVTAGETPAADAMAFPALPNLPDQTTPGMNAPCMWTPPGPGSVTIQARITYRVTFWASGFTEPQPDYLWTSAPVTFATGDLSAVNTND